MNIKNVSLRGQQKTRTSEHSLLTISLPHRLGSHRSLPAPGGKHSTTTETSHHRTSQFGLLIVALRGEKHLLEFIRFDHHQNDRTLVVPSEIVTSESEIVKDTAG
jgi:hypothetical protein